MPLTKRGVVSINGVLGDVITRTAKRFELKIACWTDLHIIKTVAGCIRYNTERPPDENLGVLMPAGIPLAGHADRLPTLRNSDAKVAGVHGVRHGACSGDSRRWFAVAQRTAAGGRTFRDRHAVPGFRRGTAEAWQAFDWLTVATLGR